MSNTNYVVVRAFKDKETFDNFTIGSYYTHSNEQRLTELERGGFIAPEGTAEAEAALRDEGAANRAANTASDENGAYTMVKGQRMPLKKAAQKAKETANVKAADLDRNESEAVNAGEVAKGKGSNVTHDAKAEQAAQKEAPKMEQQQQQQHQQQQQQANAEASEQQKGAAKAKTKKAD
jgi:hypothetical protein